MHPFMALWIWGCIAPQMAQRMMFDPTLADELAKLGKPL